MAMINCSECGAEISSKAPACPKCGNPVATPTNARPTPPKRASIGRKVIRTSAAIAVGFVVLVIWAGYQVSSNDNSPQVASSHASTPRPAPETPMDVSAPELYAAYKANEIAADAKYKGQQLNVSGIVASINKNMMGDPFITLVGESEFETVTAAFDKSASQQLSGLRKGQTVTVICRGAGMVLTSPMLDCK